jgi:hypothetical protein
MLFQASVVVDDVDVDLFTELGRNEAKPMAGKAKLIAGFIGECSRCDGFGDGLDDEHDDADEHDVIVSVEPLSMGDVGTDRIFVDAIRTAAAAAKGFIECTTE